MSWYGRVWNALRGGKLTRNVERELRFHLDELADELESRGMQRADAEREATRRFGNPLLQRERTRDMDVTLWLESVITDVRVAARGLIRTPGFTAVAVISLGLGIGANTAIFSLTNALLLRSLPVEDPEQLVQITTGGSTSFTNPLWEEIRDRQNVLAGALAHSREDFDLSGGGLVRRVSGAMVSGGFFTTLGVRPAAGRLFVPSDDVRGCAASAVVSAGFARREYGSERAAVGKTLPLSGHPFPIVGVADASFTGIQVGRTSEIYVPLCTIPILENDPDVLDARSRWYLDIVARPRPGVGAEQVAAALKAQAPAVFRATLPPDWEPAHQQEYLARSLDVVPATSGLSDGLRESYGRALVVLLVIVALVLLIACSNLANLLVARTAARMHENALRRAIGAGRGRLVRQLLTESLLLSFTGAVVGIVFAQWAGRLLLHFLAARGRTVSLDLALDWRVLAFTAGIAVVTGLLFGVLPAWRAARADPQSALRGRGVAGRTSRHHAGRSLVVGQIALSTALIAAAGLLLGSFGRLSTLDPGFYREGVVVAKADFVNTGFDAARRESARDEVLRRLASLPGVRSASVAKITPLSGSAWNDIVNAPEFVPRERMDALAYFNQVAPGYFATMGTPLLAGRDFTQRDGPGAPRVAVVNEAFALKYFGGDPALGKTFRTGMGENMSEPVEVVGVVKSAKYGSLTEDAPPTAYVPFGQGESWGTVDSYVLRTATPAATLANAAALAVAEVSPAISLEVGTIERQLSDVLVRPRLLATLSAFFGVLALLLAAVGLYGTIAYSVTRRRAEIGIRMALGAAARQVLRMVLGDAGRLVAVGLVLGVALAWATTRSLESLLYGVRPRDPTTLAAAAVVLGVVACVAALIPAARAARLDPMEALRAE